MLPIVRERVLANENAARNRNLIHRRMELRSRSDPFSLSNQRFVELFRLTKALTRNLFDILRPHLVDRKSLKGVSIEVKILTALRFYATGSYQRCLGQEFHSGLSQTAVHRSIHEVTVALANIADQFIFMPNTLNERNAIKEEIMHHSGFPGVVGMIDGTHIAILKPPLNEQLYINRKGYHSLNVQVICDHNLKIRGLFANFGGATHDAFIWNASQAQNFMRNIFENRERSWLIGDSGYPLQPYLMTPFRAPENDAQIGYNRALTSARSAVERCIGLWKMRFRCILRERSARYSPQFMCDIVKASAVLHNICVEENMPFEYEFLPDLGDMPEQEIQLPRHHHHAEALNIRNNIIQRYFQ